MIRRAVEGPDRGGGVATPCLDRAREEDRVDVLVLLVARGEDAVPELLDAVHDADDAAVVALVGVLAGLAVLRDRARRVAPADVRVVERPELPEPASAREERDQQVGDEPDQAQPAAAQGEAAGATATGVGDLSGVECGSSAEAHLRSVPGSTLPDARNRG